MTHAYTDDAAHDVLHGTRDSHVVVSTPREPVAARVLFVDWLRLVAAFQMLQGHTIAALLLPTHRVGKWYALWSAARGLTSVAFLFAAGLAFYIATVRDYAGHRHSRVAVLRRAKRGVRLIVLGYLLHLPVFAVASGEPRVLHAALQRWLAVDVLQCIGVSLLCLEALVLACTSAKRLAFAACVLAIGLLALTPLAAGAAGAAGAADTTVATWQALSTWLVAYITPRVGSLFPLLPWSVHMFAGVATGALILRDRTRAARHLSVLACALLLLASALRASGADMILYDHVSRLGCVVLVSALLAHGAQRAVDTPRWLRILAGETLFLYVFHVLVVYGDGYGLADRFGLSLPPWAACLAATGVVIGSCLAGLGYDRLRAGMRRARESEPRLAGASRTR